ncbi:MAG: XrtA/PEP-CTERM system TPR-repeat protein PrsT [Burkholderiaceae bacterium]
MRLLAHGAGAGLSSELTVNASLRFDEARRIKPSVKIQESNVASTIGVRLAVTMGIVLGIGSFAGCKEESAGELVAAAKVSLQKEAVTTAIVQLKSALQKDPSLSEARYLFGGVLLRSGNPAAAIVELSKARELGYPDDAVVPLLAKALLETGQAKSLLQQFGATKLGSPSANADLKSSLAVAYWQQQDVASAKLAVDQALAAVPEYPPALLLQANIKAAADDIPGARALVDAVLRTDPKNIRALYVAGVLKLSGKADLEGAQRDFEKLLEIEPRYVEAHKALFMLRLRQSDPAGAAKQLEKLRQVAPNNPTTEYLTIVTAFLKNDYKAARETMQRLQRIAPDSAPLQFFAGLIEYQDHSLLRAETFLVKGLQTTPDSAFARRLLAKIYIQEGQLDKAAAILAPALNQKPPEAETLALAGDLQQQMGNFPQAEIFYAASAKLAPDDFRSRAAIAVIKLSKGNQDGVAELETLAKNSDDPYADFALISEKMRKGDLGGALQSVEALHKKQPTKAYPLNIKGRIQEMQGDLPGARASHEQALALDPRFYPSASRLATFDIAEKKFTQAAGRFDAILKAEPSHLRALLSVANIRQRAGAPPAEIANLLANAVRLNPTEALPRLRLIEVYAQSKNMRAAAEAADAAAAAIPDNPGIINALGGVQLSQGQYGPAQSTFAKLASLEPKSAYPYFRQAEVQLAAGDKAAAIKALNRSLQATPNYLAAQRSLVGIDMLDRKYDDALKVIRTIQSQRPKEDIGFLLEGDVEAARSRWEQSTAAYRTALTLAPTTEAATKLHAVLAASGKGAEAARFAETWNKQHAGDVQFVLYLARRAMDVGQYAEAEILYRKAIEIKPDHAIAHGNLASALLLQKKGGALAQAEQANALLPGNVSLMETLATALAADGKYDKAVAIQQQAVAQASDKSPLILSLAKLYIQAGEKGKARDELLKLKAAGDGFSGKAEVEKLLTTL